MTDAHTHSHVVELIDEANKLFPGDDRPEHFTNYLHCCECAEHDDTLRAHTPDSIGLEQIRSPAWDPITFTTDEGFRYYFPALVRLALTGTGDTYFVDQLLSHLICDGPENRRWKAFSNAERRYVVRVLNRLLETRAEEIDQCMDADRLVQAIEIWSRGDGESGERP